MSGGAAGSPGGRGRRAPGTARDGDVTGGRDRSLRARFRAVATVGVVCALLLGGVVLGLTGSVAIGVAVALSVAVLLVGLGVVGVRQGEAQPAALAAHEARQRRLREALESEQRRLAEPGSAGDAEA